ncbi:Leucine--tRNA ligase, cytoplasmic [Thelohanellus kitauei]|uniref:leucine--tRNA ligase n=1 Tax=Thelohanellus kitauei TaxID=669202 RepID=A0A0C2MXY3_THEKT|nr:Leucine--tRNA ligase, cytoplasmic [Thelohanellus kitauei]
MNGRLHLGHAYSLSRCEFAVGYHRLLGKTCLFPFGFHCTGMPIRASADKLKLEISTYGNPPKFPADYGQSQWNSMKKMGLTDSEIVNFSDPYYWPTYFPPIGMTDLSGLGVKIDKRRSFITTDANPFYDSFVRWQLNKLKERGRVKFGARHTIFSPLDNQPCMDHDRMVGETVCPQEFVAVKHEMVYDKKGIFKNFAGQKIYLLASTLRPETLYGETNLFVHPDLKYHLFKSKDDSLFVASLHAIRNMAYQGITHTPNSFETLIEIDGSALIGCRVKTPISSYSEVPVLPMMSIKSEKGTGLVISVPSDSPDDYAAVRDLKSKQAFRQKYDISDEMVNFDPVEIINVPPYGTLVAQKVVDELKIASQNDVALKEAKEKVYKASYYSGTLLVGEWAGSPLITAKPEVKKLLIDTNHAFTYQEPESKVISRSRDTCVVALCDQWYLSYGDEQWKLETRKALDQLNTFSEEVRNNFLAVLDWLHEHACARIYGLGTKLPWDPQYLVESLSDSTIYMAYYTVCHILQQGSLRGSGSSIDPRDMTDEIWDYIFLDGPLPATKLDTEVLNKMKKEFNFWYPLDLRVSGKDLIPNHLTFCLFNHVAMWPQRPDLWPRAFGVNGYLMLNSEKMSKSTGNFLLLADAVEKYGADATRIALADAGDTVEDANFVEKTADSSILRLFKLIEWTSEMLKADDLREGPLSLLADKIFSNAINQAIFLTKEAYEKMQYREVLKYGLYELQASRDWYRELSIHSLHKDLVFKYLQVQCILLAPICPHVCDHIYQMVFGKSIMVEKWPTFTDYDKDLISVSEYLESSTASFRTSLKSLKDAKAKKKTVFVQPKEATIYVGDDFLDWQNEVLAILKDNFDKNMDKKVYSTILKQHPKLKGLNMQKTMSFLSYYKAKLEAEGLDILDASRFDECEILLEIKPYLLKTLELEELRIQKSSNEGSEDALPLKPVIIYKN